VITTPEQTFTASTAPVTLLYHTVAGDPTITLLIKNTSANGATLTGTGTTTTTVSLAAGASTVLTVGYGEKVTAIRSGASDATLSVLTLG
jgi:hypothetical protein